MTRAGGLDPVIVGAGAAGLAAARTARDLGLNAVLCEAMDRIGGRAHTDTAAFGVPWDRGHHWLHSADVNPFTPLADAYGFRWANETEQAAALAALEVAGEATSPDFYSTCHGAHLSGIAAARAAAVALGRA